jgi:predicted CoA-binding protein
MKDIARMLQEPDTTVAVIGATDDPTKYGSVIYRDLKRKGFRVFAVNPNRSTVDGDLAYPTIHDLPERPTILNFVVPPSVTLQLLDEARQAGHENVWIQPGAESPQVLAYIQAHDFNYLANACIMVRSRVLT